MMRWRLEITTGRFVLWILLLQVLVWPEIILGLKTFCFRDFGLFGYPIAHYHREAFWSGRIPHWNPLSNCGIPFLAQWNTLTLYPGSLIYLLLPLPWSLGQFCLGHQLLGAAGAFRLFKAWSGSTTGATLAATAFAFNGFALNCIHWPNNAAALGWMPWVILGMEGIAREGWRSRCFWYGLLPAALQMLTGAPELTGMTWLVGGVLCMARLGMGSNPLHALHLMVAGVIVFLLCAAQLLPFLSFLGLSQRDTSFGGAEWSMPALGFGQFFLPNFQAYLRIQGVPLQHGQYWITGFYCGVLPVVLAAFAFGREDARRQKWVPWAAAMLVLAIWMAMGDQGLLYKMVRSAVPQIGWMRFPVKWIVPACLVLPLLAAVGFGALERAEANTLRRRLWIIAATTFGLSGLLAALDVAFPLIPTTESMASRHTRSLIWQLILLGGSILCIQWHLGSRTDRTRILAAWTVPVVSLFLVLDCVRSFPRSGIHVPPGVYRPGILDNQIQAAAGTERVMLGREAILSYMKVNLPDPTASFLIKRSGQFANANLLDEVAKVDGFFSLTPRWSAEVVETLFARQDPRPLPLLDFLCVKALSPQANSWEKIQSGRITNWVWGVSRVDASTNIDQVIRRGWEPWREAWIEPAWDQAGESTGGGRVDASVEILRVEFQPEKIEVEVNVREGTAGMVTLAQSWHPGWTARVDGAESRVWRINHGFMGVRVKPGRHRLVFEYKDRAWQTGVWISALAWSCWGVGFWRTGRSGTNPAV